MKKVSQAVFFKVFLCLILIFFKSSPSFCANNLEGIEVYQKNIHASGKHKQRLVDDITRYQEADDLWEVLRDEFSLPHYENNPIIQAKIRWYLYNQEYLARTAKRAAPYLYYILQQVKKRHLPAEMVLLPIIESGYNPFSISQAGASGIWQLMPGTATGLGVKKDAWYDGRRDLISSTRAALNYLAYLQNFFEGNWLLAIAAYNTGEGNVLAAIKRNIREGKRTDFWSLPVAQQTKDYVPSLLALAAIISHPERYPIHLPPVKNAPYLGQVDIGQQINLQLAASLAGISYKRLIQLNPGFNRVLTAKRGPYKIVLPIENIERFSTNLAKTKLETNQLQWFHYVIKPGDTLAHLSKKFNSSVPELRKVNNLNGDFLKPGKDLLIPPNDEFISSLIKSKWLAIKKSAPKYKKVQFAATKNSRPNKSLSDSRTNYELQAGDTIYLVRPKDTLEKIARRFQVSSQYLLAVNRLKTNQVAPGEQLIIPTHLAG